MAECGNPQASYCAAAPGTNAHSNPKAVAMLGHDMGLGLDRPADAPMGAIIAPTARGRAVHPRFALDLSLHSCQCPWHNLSQRWFGPGRLRIKVYGGCRIRSNERSSSIFISFSTLPGSSGDHPPRRFRQPAQMEPASARFVERLTPYAGPLVRTGPRNGLRHSIRNAEPIFGNAASGPAGCSSMLADT